MIIDAHIHLPVVSEDRTFDEALAKTLTDMTKDDIDYAILISDSIPDSHIGDLDTCLDLVENEPRLFLMGTMDIENHGEEWLDKLETLIIQQKIVGMKIFPGHDPIYPTDERLSPLYVLCQAHAIPMVIHTGWNPGHPEVAKYNDPKYIVQIALKYPDLRIVIAHYFWPEVEYCYELTHPHANILYDTSGLADREVVEETGRSTIETVLTETINKGPARVIFGTDYAGCSQREHIDLIKGLPISDADREAVFWRNAARLFNLDRFGIE
jgi:predicted TIM-barrel fold metal-dependent hydrolase